MECDLLIIGGGMAGASAAYEIAASGAATVLAEMEDTPGYHTTGRSAAQYTETYGVFVIRALTKGSRPFFDTPPPGFADHPLLSPRDVLHVARPDQVAKIEAFYEECRGLSPGIHLLSGEDAQARHSGLRPGYAARALLEPEATDIDVHAIHQGFLRGFRAQGGSVLTGAEVRGLTRRRGRWRVDTAAGEIVAPIVVNAAGAWADHIAALSGLAPLGLLPKRRTVITFDGPENGSIEDWPLTIGADEEFYFKPESGRILASPGDETPSPPCDAQPDEMDVAIAVDRVERASILTVRHIHGKWAGLRSFFPDKTPVAGFDPRTEGFFWLAGQGGYGIQTAPALARLAAALVAGADVPEDLRDLGVEAAVLAPPRLIDAVAG